MSAALLRKQLLGLEEGKAKRVEAKASAASKETRRGKRQAAKEAKKRKARRSALERQREVLQAREERLAANVEAIKAMGRTSEAEKELKQRVFAELQLRDDARLRAAAAAAKAEDEDSSGF